MTTEEKIWQRLKAAGYNDFGIAGLMGNLYAESALSTTNLQNTYEKKLGMNDAAYTAAVTIKMGKLTDLEEAYEIMLGGAE